MQDQKYDNNLISTLQEYWNLGNSFYAKEFRKMRLLDATDRGDFWKAINAKFPKYQILPDTNHVTYIKNNLLASIYSVVKSAEVLPTSEQDKDVCINLNIVLDWIWDVCNVGMYQFQAGERAALLNFGLTQVGWNENYFKGNEQNALKGVPALKNINPLKFMRDPYAIDLEHASWCCTYEDYHKSFFEHEAMYKEAFKNYLIKDGSNADATPSTITPDGISTNGAKDYYTLVKWWVAKDGKIAEYHTINNRCVLYSNEDIKPSMFPFAELFCNLPSDAIIGTSEPAKIFANSVAYNMMDSLALTSEYKNQFPPRFISDQSKLNVQAFAKHGNEADQTFVVSGDATRAVHYHQYPQVSNIVPAMKQSLDYNIQNVSGIDGHYTGRDTGSIITTGGTEEMLGRVTMIDTPKITLYENYCKRLTELILRNMLQFCPKRSFFVKKENSTKFDTITVDFPKLDKETLFNYRIAVSSELPKNKQHIAAMATELLEAQAQYNQRNGTNVQWITEEEWLMFQDLPMKEYMLERMGIQRNFNALQEVAQTLYTYANLVQNGMGPDDAMVATAESLQNQRTGNPTETMTAGTDPNLEAMAAGGGAV